MGSGKRFRISTLDGWGKSLGIGLWVSYMSEHTISINITLLLINVYIGFGKGYDEL